MDKQLEMTQELRKARNWILAVGLLMFVIDVVTVHVVYGGDLPSAVKNQITIYSALVLAYFLGMWQLARVKPRLACVLALVGFWGLHLYMATQDPTSLFKGIILKVLFTLALIRGIQSAGRAELLKRELEQVFA